MDPSINSEKFTGDEDRIILDFYNKHGPRWCELTKILNGRPEN